MYVPTHFAESRPAVLHALIRARPLATLISASARGFEANHVPFTLAPGAGGSGSLLGHVARQSAAWRLAAEGGAALAVFHGPSAYISPSYYPAKREHGRVVPTWNYVVVHAHGSLRVHDDPAWVRHQVDLLTAQMESARPEPWSVGDAPADYVERMLRGIVGIELVIERLEGKWKLGQNHPAANREGAAASLDALGDAESAAMAALIRSHGPE